MDAPAAQEPVPRPELCPVAAGERLSILDSLRGFAILGILLVNMHLFFAPLWETLLPIHWFPSALDEAASAAVTFFAQAKFYTLFSFLFGVGLAIQMRRAQARGRTIGRFWARRMTVLLAIGLVHGLLIWFGDVLALYALLGYPLLLFRTARPRTLLIWGAVLLAFPLVPMTAFAVLIEVARSVPRYAADLDAATAGMGLQADAALAAYRDGGYGALFAMRVSQWLTVWQYVLVGWFGNILGLFVLGLWAGRERVFDDPDRLAERMRRVLLPVAAIAVVANAGFTVLSRTLDQSLPSPALVGQQVLSTIGAPAMTFTYVGVLVLLARGPARGAVARLAPVGRMALTNYLTHSIVFTTAANFYGLGLYGRISPAVGVALTFAMFAAQIAVSPWWLARFRFGPVEWLWRSLSYGRLQPMRRETPAG